MATLGYRGKQKKALSNAKFVTRKAKLRMMNILDRRGVMGFQTNTHHSTGDHRWIQKGLKTTKFIQSKPVVKFKGEPPF
jgi:hypothetical protein|tara:strand:- start:2136 stop:2372 length:237 start_codon:yes stop_codon:yes gene_type:complete